jgi:hypothetical protein
MIIGDESLYVFKPRPSWGARDGAAGFGKRVRFTPVALRGARAPMGRRLRAATRCGAEEVVVHPHWPQIVSTWPAGVNPAERPDPAGNPVEQLAAGRVVRSPKRDRGFRVDSDHPREESARIVGMGTFVRTSPAGVATVRSGYAGCHSPLEGGQVHEPVAR